MGQDIVTHKTLHAVDGYAFIGRAAIALFLAGMSTYTGCDHGNGIGLHQDSGGSCRISISQLFHIRRNIRIGRTLYGTWRKVCLHSSENGMITVVAQYSVALLSALSHTIHAAADSVRITIKPAAYVLTDISADGSHVPDQRSRHRAGRLRQDGCLFIQQRRFYNI